MFQNGKELENFPTGRRKFNDTENITKLVYMAVERGGGWER